VTKDGAIQVDSRLMTGHPGVFAGGDMIPFNKTVTTAVGHGKKAARHIDAYLKESSFTPAPKHTAARFDLLRLDWYPKITRMSQPMRPAEERACTFEATVGGLSTMDAVFE